MRFFKNVFKVEEKQGSAREITNQRLLNEVPNCDCVFNISLSLIRLIQLYYFINNFKISGVGEGWINHPSYH